MTLGSRLREERTRLGLSQTAFAGLAGAKKGTQISWEKDASSPTAAALMAFADAGADVMYILTGKKEFLARDDEEWVHIIDEIQRTLLDPVGDWRPNETEEQRHERILKDANARLSRILQFDSPKLRPEIADRLKALLSWTENPTLLVAARAEDYARKHDKREFAKTAMLIWLENWEYRPNDAVLRMLVMLEVEYSVPLKLLVELANEIYMDVKSNDRTDD